MTLDKLKVAARQHEQREEWGAAIELYRQAIRAAEAAGEGADPALYNRIGDLAHKSGQDGTACEAWEQAAARYGEQGFFNNAIALCGKILRLNPQPHHLPDTGTFRNAVFQSLEPRDYFNSSAIFAEVSADFLAASSLGSPIFAFGPPGTPGRL